MLADEGARAAGLCLLLCVSLRGCLSARQRREFIVNGKCNPNSCFSCFNERS